MPLATKLGEIEKCCGLRVDAARCGVQRSQTVYGLVPCSLIGSGSIVRGVVVMVMSVVCVFASGVSRSCGRRPSGSLRSDGRHAAGVSSLHAVVVEELLDQVDVRQQHATAAVALQAEGVQRVTADRGREREEETGQA